MSEITVSVEIFCSYAHEDEEWRKKLERHLSPLKQYGFISLWHDRHIVPGTNWARTIDTHLETSSLVLLLISADFFASDYCVGIEMKRALARQEANEALVIPILVRPVIWRITPLAHLQVLPTDARPLVAWQDEEMALADVAAGIRRALEALPLTSIHAPRAALAPILNIPYPRNRFFLGRERELTQIHQQFLAGQATALSQPQAISGLGGIGKTQLALEYAYRYRRDYQTILWAHAETTEVLVSSYITLATLLHLPEREAREQDVIVQAFKTWLQTHHDWLLILDNADELTILSDFLPPSMGGHLLLTTRAAATGQLAQRLEIETLQPEHGALFLLRRATLIAPDTTLEEVSPEERELALQMSNELEGLPLALDQAGAYLEETGASLSSYWQIYQQYRADLLRYRGKLVADHPASVATTWSLSFQRAEKKYPDAADLLRLCAFLSPDVIPEEILTAGASFLGPTLAPVAANAFRLNQAIEALRAYSLIRRDPKGKTLSIHRLVQAVLQDTLDDKTRRLWAERAMLAVNAAFPHVERGTELQCERLLPQSLKVAQVIEYYQIVSDEAGHSLYETASYLRTRGRYASAEPLLLRAMSIWKHLFGEEHLSVVNLLAGLANLYEEWGKYAEAETLFLHVLDIWEHQFGPNHLSVGDALYGLAGLYREQGKYAQAELLFLRALHIREYHLGLEHPSVGKVLGGLAFLYRQHGRSAEAEPHCQRALYIWKQHPGSEHLDMTYPPFNILAGLYRTQGKYTEAEALLLEALHIWEQQPKPEHPDMGYSLNSLATLYSEQSKFTEAEFLYRRALQVREPQLGPKHHYLAYSLSGLALLYYKQGKKVQAEPLFQRALDIWEQSLPGHSRTAEAMLDFALLQEDQEKFYEAISLYTRGLAILEHALGAHHPKTVETRQHLITLLHALERHEEANQLEACSPNDEEEHKS